MKNIAATIFTVVLSTAISGCGSDSSDNSSKDVTSGQPTAYEGTWVATAYGEALKIEGNQLTQYQFTSQYCLISNQANNFSEEYASNQQFVINTSSQPETLREQITIHGVDYRGKQYSKLDSLPPSCNNPFEESDIELEFSWFSQLFGEYYPTFNERNVDWQQVTQTASAELTNDSEVVELIAAMDQSIQALADDHVSITIGETELQYSRNNSTPEQRLLAEFINTNGVIDSEEKAQQAVGYIQQQLNLINSIRLSYAADEDQIKSSNTNSIAWFITADNIAVIIIEGMESHHSEEGNEIADLNYLAQLMPEIINDLQDTDGLIIDVRNNTGGFDSVSQMIARYFLDNERDLYRKQARLGSGRSAAETYRLAPANTTYIKPTVLLVSGKTVSAAEVFTLMMRELPHVTVMGEVTQGAISDVLEKELPSGIQLALVNEYYTTMAGELFEVSGIPVDQTIPYASATQRAQQQDLGIETATSFLLSQ